MPGRLIFSIRASGRGLRARAGFNDSALFSGCASAVLRTSVEDTRRDKNPPFVREVFVWTTTAGHETCPCWPPGRAEVALANDDRPASIARARAHAAEAKKASEGAADPEESEAASFSFGGQGIFSRASSLNDGP